MSDALDKATEARLRKILHLAKNAGTEGEAQAAMDRAQEILTRFNLTIAEVESRPDKAAASDAGLEGAVRQKARTTGRALYEYQHRLMAQIAQANFCLVVLRRDYVGKQYRPVGYTLVGREANVVSTRLMFDYLNETLERLVPIASNAQRLSRSAISWKEGAAARLRVRIADRADELAKAREEEVRDKTTAAQHPAAAKPPPGSLILMPELTLNEEEFNIDLLYNLEPGTTTARRLARATEVAVPSATPKPETAAEKAAREARDAKWRAKYERDRQRYWDRRDMNAYWAGDEAAKDISLDRQIRKEP